MKWLCGVQLAPFPQMSPQRLLEMSLKGERGACLTLWARQFCKLTWRTAGEKALMTAIVLVTKQSLSFFVWNCIQHVLAWGCLALHMMPSFDLFYKNIYPYTHILYSRCDLLQRFHGDISHGLLGKLQERDESFFVSMPCGFSWVGYSHLDTRCCAVLLWIANNRTPQKGAPFRAGFSGFDQMQNLILVKGLA